MLLPHEKAPAQSSHELIPIGSTSLGDRNHSILFHPYEGRNLRRLPSSSLLVSLLDRARLFKVGASECHEIQLCIEGAWRISMTLRSDDGLCPPEPAYPH